MNKPLLVTLTGLFAGASCTAGVVLHGVLTSDEHPKPDTVYYPQTKRDTNLPVDIRRSVVEFCKLNPCKEVRK